jgi:hypothetical protein
VAEDGTVTYKAQTLTSEMRTAGSITIPKIVGKNSDGSGGYQSISGTYRGSADATVNPPKSKKTGSKKKDWENPYDKHYNTLEQINEALREREKLERRYQKLLEK